MSKIGQLVQVKEKAYEQAVIKCLKTKKTFKMDIKDYDKFFMDIESALVLMGSGIISRGWDDVGHRTILAIEYKSNQAVSMRELEDQLKRIR